MEEKEFENRRRRFYPLPLGPDGLWDQLSSPTFGYQVVKPLNTGIIFLILAHPVYKM